MIKQFLNIRVTYIMALRGMLFQAKRIGLHYNFEANIHGISTFTSEIGTFFNEYFERKKKNYFQSEPLSTLWNILEFGPEPWLVPKPWLVPEPRIVSSQNIHGKTKRARCTAGGYQQNKKRCLCIQYRLSDYDMVAMSGSAFIPEEIRTVDVATNWLIPNFSTVRCQHASKAIV